MLELLNNQVTAILLGGSQDITYGAFLAFEQAKPTVNLVTIDSRIDTGTEAVTADMLPAVHLEKPETLSLLQSGAPAVSCQ